MTLDTYADLFDADLDDLSARMGELLFAGVWAKCGHGRWNLPQPPLRMPGFQPDLQVGSSPTGGAEKQVVVTPSQAGQCHVIDIRR